MQWYRLDEHREISDFITCAEYQLFLDEMRVQNKFHQPAHWMEYQFPKGQALQPILGIRGEDAQAFCNWLNKRKNNDINYRLPTLEESWSFIPQDTLELASWYQEKKFLLYWCNKNQEEQIKKQCLNFSNLPIRLNYNFNDIFNLIPNSEKINITYGLNIDSYRDTDRAFIQSLDFNRNHSFVNYLLAASHYTYLSENHRLDLINDTKRAITQIELNELVKESYILRKNSINDDSSVINYVKKNDRLSIINYAITSAESLNLTNVSKLIEQKNYEEARKVVKEQNSTKNKNLILLSFLLKILTVTNKKESLIAWQSYAIDLSEYIYQLHVSLENNFKSKIKLLWKKCKIDMADSNKENILSLHWWLTIANARMEGKLPAWEGLRIVREKKFD
jgi:hypothetical protein